MYDGLRWDIGILADTNIAPNGILGRNVDIGFSSDGVNMFDSGTHNAWPLATICFNLPGHMRMSLPAIGLMCIIPPHGQKRGEPHDFQPYMNILADQLRFGYHYGFAGMVDGSWRQAFDTCSFYMPASIHYTWALCSSHVY